jgi:hypothetical protein
MRSRSSPNDLNLEAIVKTWIASVIAFLALALITIEAKEPTSAIMGVTWNVSLDASGHVMRFETKDKRVPKLHARLTQAIRGWRFSSGKVNGEPAATKTQLQTRLKISLVDDGFEVRLIGASTGGGYRSIKPTHSPEYADKKHKQACVALEVRYDERGNVIAAKQYEGIAKADRQFVQAALDSVKNWTFEPEVVGGIPISSTALVPILFEERGMQDAPLCKWTVNGTNTEMSGGQAVALNPAAKLDSDVIGHTL